MQGAQPAIAVGRVNSLVGPIEVHVVFARCVADLFEHGGSLWFSSDILCLEKIEHAQAINRFRSFRALVDVGSERHFRRIKSPGRQAILAHSAVTRLVVGPSRSVVDPFPGKHVGKLAQDDAAVFDSPNLVQVADRGTQLQEQPFAVGKI